MKYYEYSVEDFVVDEFFQEWIKNPDAASNVFWNKWIKNNPHKKCDIEEARHIILSFNFENSNFLDKQTEQALARLHNAIFREEQRRKIAH